MDHQQAGGTDGHAEDGRHHVHAARCCGIELEHQEVRADDQRDRRLDQIGVRGAQPPHDRENRDHLDEDRDQRRLPGPRPWFGRWASSSDAFPVLCDGPRPARPPRPRKQPEDPERDGGDAEGDARDAHQGIGNRPGPGRPCGGEDGHHEDPDPKHSHENIRGEGEDGAREQCRPRGRPAPVPGPPPSSFRPRAPPRPAR